MAPTFRLIDEDIDAETYPAYVPPTIRTSPTVPRTTQNQSRLVTSHMVTARSLSASGSSSHGRTASSDKATSAGDIPVLANTEPPAAAEEQNRWCRHRCEWMARSLGNYSKEIMREFYASYAATLRGSIDRRSNYAAEPSLRETLVHGERVEWVKTPTVGIRKATLTFVIRLPIGVKQGVSYAAKQCSYLGLRSHGGNPSCSIRDGFFPNDNYGDLGEVTKTLNIGLIRDEANVAAPHKELHMEVPQLRLDLVIDVEKIHPPTPTEDAPASHSLAVCQALRSSRATPFSVSPTMPLARVQNLEAQMATLLQHLASLWADLDILLAPPQIEPESASTTPVVDTVLDALFGDDIPPPSSSHHAGKLPHSSWASEDNEAKRAHKRECQQVEEARRASIVDEETHQQRAREVVLGSSSSVRTTNGTVRVADSTIDCAVTVDAGTTEGDPTVDLASSEKPNSLIC
uniref:Integrase core domain containing protein n=1 Tax=Solanum tuberosum TaxID=4113 RepID=M1DTK3_SOLTU